MTYCHCEYILFKLPVSFIVPEVALVHVEQTFEVTWHVCMYINIHHRPSKIMSLPTNMLALKAIWESYMKQPG